MKSKEIVKNILNDIKVELSDEFDRNFSRGAFFDKKWPAKKDGSASHLIKTGKLRRSIRATLGTDFVRFTSSEQYAGIHNEGGDITVTRQMQKFFWAKYKETGSESYKAMALKKINSKIHIPQRKFIGNHEQIQKAVREIINDNLKSALNNIKK